MLNFDEEIQKFQPVLEREEIEHSIQSSDISDLSDLLVAAVRKTVGTKTVKRP